MPATLTVIVPTYNEEHNIRACVESVSFADDIFVVDSFSTDRTPELARELTQHFVQHEYVNSATQKNWAIAQAKGDWLMVLDADERVTPELAARIQNIMAEGSEFDAFNLRRANIFLGELIRHGGWHKDYLVRLWRNGKGRYEELHVHADVVVEGKVGTLEEPLLHDTYRSLDDFLEKLGRYSNWSANDLYNKNRRASLFNLTVRPLWRFLRMYVVRGGFLDGRRGLMIAWFSAFNVFLKYARLWDRLRREQSGAPPDEKRSTPSDEDPLLA